MRSTYEYGRLRLRAGEYPASARAERTVDISTKSECNIGESYAPDSSHYINRVVIKAARNADIREVLYVDSGGRERAKITAHALRHSFAAHSVKNGMDIKNLQTLLGHENLDTTETYLQFRQEEVRNTARKYGAGVGNNDDCG